MTAEVLLIPSKLIGFARNLTKLNIIWTTTAKKSQWWFT